jgi:hypothetical protein
MSKLTKPFLDIYHPNALSDDEFHNSVDEFIAICDEVPMVNKPVTLSEETVEIFDAEENNKVVKVVQLAQLYADRFYETAVLDSQKSIYSKEDYMIGIALAMRANFDCTPAYIAECIL